jgi:hypothetical protein
VISDWFTVVEVLREMESKFVERFSWWLERQVSNSEALD